MTDRRVRLRSEFVAEGFTDDLLAGLVRREEWQRIRRGAYRPPEPATPEERHRDLVLATLALQQAPAVASHVSAAVLHGLPVDRRRLGVVHLMRAGKPRGDHRGPVWRHWRPEFEQSEVDRIPVTSLADTVLDVARTTPFRDAVAAVDAGLRIGLDRTDLLTRLAGSPGRRGNAVARRAVLFGDPRSESAGESHSRALMSDLQLPIPDLQRIFVVDGVTMRTDFVWDEARVVGEFDGKVKYGRLLEPGQELGDVGGGKAESTRRIHFEHCWKTTVKAQTYQHPLPRLRSGGQPSDPPWSLWSDPKVGWPTPDVALAPFPGLP